jgi:hypothetical protein
MEGALCVPSSKRSLLDAVGVCVKKKFGLVIDEGGASARYMRGGVSVLELEKIVDMFCFAPLLASAMFVSSDLRSLHERTMTVSCFGVSSGFDLKQHCMDSHWHFSSFCPWCVQARLRKKRALRMSHGNRSLKSGYGVGCDFTGPFDPDVDGFTLALVVVEV